LPQHDIELILMRQLAGSLALPVFLVDPAGTLVYYNEPAEAILGRRFEETYEMPASEWSTVFDPRDETGARMNPNELPLMVAMTQGRPRHSPLHILGLDGTLHRIEVAAFPLIGQDHRLVGAVALFWESDP
jgi:PAS domain-containing protein